MSRPISAGGTAIPTDATTTRRHHIASLIVNANHSIGRADEKLTAFMELEAVIRSQIYRAFALSLCRGLTPKLNGGTGAEERPLDRLVVHRRTRNQVLELLPAR